MAIHKPCVAPLDVPVEAAVNLPCASTVMLELVYDPAETAVLAIFNVTDPEVPPPDNPVPAVTPVMSPVVGVAQAGFAPPPPVVKTSPEVPADNLVGAPEAP